MLVTVNHLKKHLIFLQALSTTATSTHPKQDDYTPEILKSPQNEIRKLIWTRRPPILVFPCYPFLFGGLAHVEGLWLLVLGMVIIVILYSDTTKISSNMILGNSSEPKLHFCVRNATPRKLTCIPWKGDILSNFKRKWCLNQPSIFRRMC